VRRGHGSRFWRRVLALASILFGRRPDQPPRGSVADRCKYLLRISATDPADGSVATLTVPVKGWPHASPGFFNLGTICVLSLATI
jgi:hypothetical protein